MKKIVAPILLFLVLIVIGAIGFVTIMNLKKEHSIETITGLIGSEKEPFFKDPEVQHILQTEYKIKVEIQKAGSREIANKVLESNDYSFVFPSGEPAAQKIKQTLVNQKPQEYRVFFTPMTVASWQPVVNVLEKNGIVKKQSGYYGILDMQKLLVLMEKGTRWKDLPNNQNFNIGRKVLIKSTNISKSNSAAMYLSLASYLFNNDEVVQSPNQINTVLPKVTPLFANQGFQANSSATPFNDYLVKGIGNSPMVMMYESQYLYEATQGGIRKDMVLLYPEPTIFTQHILLSLDDNGAKLGEAITNNEALQKLAIKHGFRSNNRKLLPIFEENLTTYNLDNIPSSLANVIDTPSYDNLEKMIEGIEQRMENPSAFYDEKKDSTLIPEDPITE